MSLPKTLLRPKLVLDGELESARLSTEDVLVSSPLVVEHRGPEMLGEKIAVDLRES